jgi:hypothetical protein
MEAELKLAKFLGMSFVTIPNEFLDVVGITGKTSVIITLNKIEDDQEVYGYRCDVLKKGESFATGNTNLSSRINKRGHMKLPRELARTLRMALEFDEKRKCLVFWAYID